MAAMTRERDRYRRASWGEQLREAFLGFWRNRTARIVAAIILSGALIMRLLTPDLVSLAGLAVGDCLYLRPPGAPDPAAPLRIAGTPAALEQYDAAERASCDLSHSHEASAVFIVGGPGDAFPGRTSLLTVASSRCDSSFEPFIGRPANMSRYATAAWIPNADTWHDGVRTAACLVFDATLGLLASRARGSNR
jgi:hypothetical protein